MSRHELAVCLALCLALLSGLPATGAPAGALPAPQWVAGTDLRGKAQLVWVRNPAFSSVRVLRRDEGPAGAFRPLGETRENLWLDDTVQPGRAYRYQLVGIGPDGSPGRPSTEFAVRIGLTLPAPPAVPRWEGYLVLPEGVGLKWAANEGEDVIAWNIYRRSPPETEFRLVGSSRSTSYLDAGLQPDSSHVYVLTALDSEFRETPYSQELAVRFSRPEAGAQPEKPATAWRVRRTRLVSLVAGSKDQPFQRPADVAVGPLSGSVYVADSGRNLVFVFSPQGVFKSTLGASQGGESGFRNLLGLATDAKENIYLVDAGAGAVQAFSIQGRPGRRVELDRPEGGALGLIDAAVGPDGSIYVIDNRGNQVSIVGEGGVRVFGGPGGQPGEFSAPTFCAIDAAGSLLVADCLNARVQVFSSSGEFLRSFGRYERGPGGFGRPKGIAVSEAGELYVADSWLNTVQVFDAEGRFVAVLGDEAGRPLDLGSPNGVALGPGNRVYIAERLAARLQIREIIDAR